MRNHYGFLESGDCREQLKLRRDSEYGPQNAKLTSSGMYRVKEVVVRNFPLSFWRTSLLCRWLLHFLPLRRFSEKAREWICNFPLKLYLYFGIKTRLWRLSYVGQVGSDHHNSICSVPVYALWKTTSLSWAIPGLSLATPNVFAHLPEGKLAGLLRIQHWHAPDVPNLDVGQQKTLTRTFPATTPPQWR